MVVMSSVIVLRVSEPIRLSVGEGLEDLLTVVAISTIIDKPSTVLQELVNEDELPELAFPSRTAV